MLAKRFLSRFLLVASISALPLLAGCATYGYASYGPPVEEVEVFGVAPGPDFIWVGGHHIWRGTGYTWQKGSWQRPPRAGAHWEKGSWEHTDRGWRFREGGWK